MWVGLHQMYSLERGFQVVDRAVNIFLHIRGRATRQRRSSQRYPIYSNAQILSSWKEVVVGGCQLCFKDMSHHKNH